jgi:hypothetical protein
MWLFRPTSAKLYVGFLDNRYPVPILQVSMKEDVKYNDGSFESRFICHLSLIATETDEDTTILQKNQTMYVMRTEKPTHYNLVGPRTISNCILFDPDDGVSKIFFVCTELGIRAPGEYRIRCHIIDSVEYSQLI